MLQRTRPSQLLFEALADPTRREILELLRTGEQAAGELAARFPAISRPAVSQHLAILREAELVRRRAEGRRRVYALRPEALRSLDRWLEKYRGFWTRRLVTLNRLAQGRSS